MAPFLALLLLLSSPTPPDAAGCAGRTGSGATLLIPARPALSRAGGPLEVGDELSVLAPDGRCVGAGRWGGAGAALTVWADDPTTAEADGLRPGEPVRLVVRTPAGDYADGDVVVTFEAGFGVEGGYQHHGLYAVAVEPGEIVPAPPAPRLIVVNEVEVDAAGAGAFVELRSADSGLALDGLHLALVDGGGAVYASVDLSSHTTGADGLFVVGGAEGGAALGEVQAGVGAVAVYDHEVAVGSRAGAGGLVDAVVFGPEGAGRSDDLLARLGQAVQYVEAQGASLQRLDLAGGGGPFASALLHPRAATPGAGNGREVTVDRTAEVQDGAGLRLVSVPVVSADGEPKAVGDLAAINLVRGVAGGDHPAQYPGAQPNVLTAFDNAGGGFVAPASTDEALAPGDGFFWHWFDEEAAPSAADGGGTSWGHALESEAFAFTTTGVPIDDALLSGPYEREVSAPTDSGVYLIGNPYPYPLRLSGVTVAGGALQTTVAVWDPARGTYEDLFSGPDGTDDVLPVWGGAVAEVYAPRGSFTVVTTSAAVDPTAAAPVEAAARRQTATTAARLSLELSGTLEGGAAVADASAHVRFVEGAEAGWDVHDGSKLTPPTEAFALVAPVGQRDGELRRQRVLSLPTALSAPRAVPIAFAASEGGAFTLRWDVATLPAGWGARLHDLKTGDAVDLRGQTSYAFETGGAAPWSERFEVVVSPAATAGEAVAERETTVGPAYPNPAVGPVRLDVHAATAQRVAADVYDALGRRVARAYEGSVGAGTPATVSVDTSTLAPGLYMVRVEGETFAETRRMVVAR
ncbi:T9SS type A sorting domain-containing protein [Rubrivirga litoralis]|uniref:T9SS type A sorting domain-containing protein n=1 Tax=Rubrivirga litoralis TaxID=3075598 RepID=A0ABU3BPL4_9BACT|nr:T9SS type A sorting domain-containing protein [Rubrivirga sp. F394]MDT0631230.1 T9SS type A sorting domain-containing protein [Rubrivirga sp. F394]